MGTLMLSSSSSSSQLMVFHRLLRPAPILSFSFLKRSLSLLPHRTTSLCPITINNSSSCVLRSRTFSNLPALVSSSQALLESTEDVEYKEIAKENGEVTAAPSLRVKEKKELPSLTVKEKKELPSLTVKEKKELASYAHSLGKKLKSQQVGKSGVTDSVIFALDETLEANELLKLKIHGTCPGGELDDVVKHLEEATGSVVVGQIGRTVILYRPSVTKLKAEEKKKQAQNAFMRKKQYAAKQSFESKEQVPRPYARGRRGSSRV